MRRLLAAAAAVLALTGCGLPLPEGVATAGRVPDEQPRDGAIAVLPAGPLPGATARDVVVGFLGAQSSPEGGHAVARRFLTPDAARTWRDDAGVEVYDAAEPLAVEQTSNPEIVTVRGRTSAVVSPDGAFRRRTVPLEDTYRVRCADGTCRIAALEDGLRLTPTDFTRSFQPLPVHFLAPSYADTTSTGHLVADLVWLPRTDEAGGLVRALLAGPSSALEGSVTSAVPVGTRLLRPVRTGADGTVTVDLSATVRALDARRLEQLSAQLVWTLRSLGPAFTRLRLLVEGAPVEVEGSTAAQRAAAWPEYDPERLRSGSPALYLDDRQLRSLVDGGLASSPATEGQLAVDAAAASPDGFLALLTDVGGGRSALRTGPQGGPFDPVRATGVLSSPTWGSGEQGLFLVRDGAVVRLPQQGAPAPVPVVGLDRPVRRVQVARDGVRVALLVGDAASPHLLVGRLEQDSGGTRVADAREIAPPLEAVVDVAWETSTSLVVLARFPFGRLPARVAVDGFTASPPLLGSRLPEGLTPVSLTAAPGRPVVLAGTAGGEQAIYRDTGQGFRRQARGRAPFYPG